MPGAKLVCLLPVRNGTDGLPGYFESVARFAGAVVALDDGSTDDTLALLEGEPLVRVFLSNPPRPDYRSWDDPERARQLLEERGVSQGEITDLIAKPERGGMMVIHQRTAPGPRSLGSSHPRRQ